MLTVLGDGSCIDFLYQNDKVPQVTSQGSFMEQACRVKWIDKMLDHLAGGDCSEEDAAEWLSYYLRKRYNGAFTLALDALHGLTLSAKDGCNKCSSNMVRYQCQYYPAENSEKAFKSTFWEKAVYF
jgi:hypothetical protein